MRYMETATHSKFPIIVEKVTIVPGDVLFVPKYYFHDVVNGAGGNIGIGTRTFFKSYESIISLPPIVWIGGIWKGLIGDYGQTQIIYENIK